MSIVGRGLGTGGGSIGAIVASGYSRDLNKLLQLFAFAVQDAISSLLFVDQVDAFLVEVAAANSTMGDMIETTPPQSGVVALPPLDEVPS